MYPILSCWPRHSGSSVDCVKKNSNDPFAFLTLGHCPPCAVPVSPRTQVPGPSRVKPGGLVQFKLDFGLRRSQPTVTQGRRPSEEGVLWPHLPSSQIPTPLPVGAVHVQVQGWCETSPNSPFFQIWVPAAGWQWMRYGNPRTTRLLGRHWDEVSSLYRPSPGAACGPDPPLPQAGPPLVSFTPQPNCPLPNWEPAQRCVRVLWVWASKKHTQRRTHREVGMFDV